MNLFKCEFEFCDNLNRVKNISPESNVTLKAEKQTLIEIKNDGNSAVVE